jgi:hypothetical protein
MKNIFTKKIMRAKSGKSQKGVTLTEMGVVLGIGAVILITGFMVVPKMLAESNAKKLNDAFTMSIPKIQAAYNSRTSFTGLTTAAVANNGWFNDSMVQKTNGVPTGVLVTPWANGTIAFAATGTGGIQGQVTLTNVPSAVCNSLADSMLPNDMFLTATINAASVKALNREVDYAVTGTQCSGTNTNTIVAVFSRS